MELIAINKISLLYAKRDILIKKMKIIPCMLKLSLKLLDFTYMHTGRGEPGRKSLV
jgi:hypothetical protein